MHSAAVSPGSLVALHGLASPALKLLFLIYHELEHK